LICALPQEAHELEDGDAGFDLRTKVRLAEFSP
jgi:hypothetical protein